MVGLTKKNYRASMIYFLALPSFKIYLRPCIYVCMHAHLLPPPLLPSTPRKYGHAELLPPYQITLQYELQHYYMRTVYHESAELLPV